MARTINLKSRHDEVERRLVQLIGIRIADRNTTQIESAHRCDTRPVCRSFRAAIVFLFCFFCRDRNDRCACSTLSIDRYHDASARSRSPAGDTIAPVALHSFIDSSREKEAATSDIGAVAQSTIGARERHRTSTNIFPTN